MGVLDGLKLEVAFASGPFDAAPVWTDITAYWLLSQSTQVTRGRGSEQDQVSTGTLSLTLDNTDGRFTVDKTSSPYYPNVKLRKQIRITYTQSAVTYPIFKGYVDEWPVTWPDGGGLFASAQVRASDRFKTLGSPRTLRSVPEEEVLLSVPQSYYPMGESSGATAASDISGEGAAPLTVAQYGTGGTVAFGDGIGASTDGMAAPVFTFGTADGSSGKALVTPTTSDVSQQSGASVEVCASSTQTTYTNYLIQVGRIQYRFPQWSPTFRLAVSTTGVELLIAVNHFDTEAASASVAGLVDGSTHHYAVTVTPDGVTGTTFRVYVDGVLRITYTTPRVIGYWEGTILRAMRGLIVGGACPYPGTTFYGFQGTISHVVTYTSILSAATVARHATAMRTGFAGESTGARVARVADWAGIATGDRVIATGSTTSVRHVDTTGKTALGYIQELADTESGLALIDTSGRLEFQARSQRVNAASALTLSAASQQVSNDVAYRSNDQFLTNDTTYFREGGVSSRVVDATSIADYGRSDSGQTPSGAHETYTTSDGEVTDRATWAVYTGKTPAARIEGLGVDLLTDSTSRVAAVQLDLSDKVTVTNMPTAAPGSTATVFVEGYTEAISLAGWHRSLNTSPAGQYSPLWQLGTAGFSELGVTTTLNF